MRSAAARRAAWAFVGLAGRSILQIFYFILLARALGATNYGEFAGAAGLATLLSPLTGLGSGTVMIMKTAVEPQMFSVYWGNTLIKVVITGCVLALTTVVIALLWLPSLDPILVVNIAVAELLLARLVESSCQAFQAHSQLQFFTLLQISLSICRLAAVVFLLATDRPVDAVIWSRYYLIATLAVAALSLTLTFRQYGPPLLRPSSLLRDNRLGAYFVLGRTSMASLADLDKVLLTRMTSAAATGNYAAAYRVVQTSFIPILAILTSTYPRFFEAGHKDGLSGTISLARKLALPSGILAGAGALVVLALSPLLPRLLGESFGSTSSLLQILWLLPVLQTIHYLCGDCLSGSGYQSSRALLELSAVGVNVALNVLLIPRYLASGAAIATILTEALLAFALFFYVGFLLRRGGEPSTPDVHAA